MFNKSILGPFPTSHLDLRAMTWRCKCLRTCTCITIPDHNSCEFLGHHLLRNVIFTFIFVFLTHSCIFYPPHLTQTSGPLSTKQFIFLACIWHISAPGLAPTSHVVNFVHCNTHTHSPDLYPRATSVCLPLLHRLAGLCHDLSHTYIGMFESLLLRPYYMDDL